MLPLFFWPTEVGPNMATCKRRLSCPQTVQHLWDAIDSIRQQKQVSNLDRVANYMRRKHHLSAADTDRQLGFAVRDDLLVSKKKVGSKGSKVGVEQEAFQLPEQPVERDGHDWYCFECHRGGDVLLCTGCHRVYHVVCVKEDLSNEDHFVCTVCHSRFMLHLFVFGVHFVAARVALCPACANVKQGNVKPAPRVAPDLALSLPQQLQEKEPVTLKVDDMNVLLSYTCLRLKEKTKDLHRLLSAEGDAWKQNHLIYQKMDLITMEEKTRNNEYTSLQEFHADAQTIVHNVVIYYGSAFASSLCMHFPLSFLGWSEASPQERIVSVAVLTADRWDSVSMNALMAEAIIGSQSASPTGT
ncbi:hypothetical protein HPB48_000146 [Haemaphysalis longicornis]|uniref:Zinc finger PHD-type domain-containing protein n=1 Tax=Haemaphysalis longicornis TaxID=44386 RepID=A0A9J6G1X1_HAELO|nr:hypothetical protein HPB48_000146 [Haemaphysalis longicornis]